MIVINSNTQTLTFKDKIYPISAAKNGLGEEEGSFKTPRGRFQIIEKIGAGEEIYTIFKTRKKVGIWDKKPTKEDLILSRILWLDGLENSNKNTKGRYIYIHGTNDEESIGKPTSQGCIRMKNSDITQLFDLVKVDDSVVIT